MKILIATDAFPPGCGGSGWSTYELARGLRAHGHDVLIVQPRPSDPPGVREREYDGLRIRVFGVMAPNLPYVRNYYKSERLTRTLGAYLGSIAVAERPDVIHAQHVLTTLPAIEAGGRARIPVVATVRDYWPVCYWSDLLHTRTGLALCPACTIGNMTQCIRPRAGAAWPLALPLIPYMRANLRSKRAGLARADAIVAVSRRIAEDLMARAPDLRNSRLEIIPNPVNVADLRSLARQPTPHAAIPAQPYALYLGKLAPNKGTDALVDVVVRAGLDWPLIVAGDGVGRAALERAAVASHRDIRFSGWVAREEALRLLNGASMLIFPSRGPESLSRVLIEASALGVAIAAMDTGGTREIIEHGVTGLLSSNPDALADDVRRLRHDATLRERLGCAAAARVEREFDAGPVVARVENLYRAVIAERT